MVTPNRAHNRGSSLTYFTPLNNNVQNHNTQSSNSTLTSKNTTNHTTPLSLVSPSRLSFNSSASNLAPASITRRKRSNTYATSTRLRHKLSLDMISAKLVNGNTGLVHSATTSHFASKSQSGVNPFYNPSSFLSPTKSSPANTPLPTPNQDDDYYSKGFSPFKINFANVEDEEDHDVSTATITNPHHDESGHNNNNTIDNLHSSSSNKENEERPPSSLANAQSNSSDTIVELNSLMKNFSDNESTFVNSNPSSASNSNLEFLELLSNPSAATTAPSSHNNSTSGNNLLFSHSYDDSSFNNDIFLQAADLTLKMVSQSKPVESNGVNQFNIANNYSTSTINPHLINGGGSGDIHNSGYVNQLQQQQQNNGITKSEGTINLASYVNTSDVNVKQLPFNTVAQNPYFGNIPTNEPMSHPQAHIMSSQLVHSHSQPNLETSQQPFNYSNGYINQLLQQPLDHQQQLQQHAQGNNGQLSSVLPNGLPANLVLPEGLDESKLILKKSKRGRKSTTTFDDKKNKKNHECPLCGSRFQRPEHVKRHMRSHSSEKPFHCDQPNCGKRFNRSDNLKAHLRKIHKLAI